MADNRVEQILDAFTTTLTGLTTTGNNVVRDRDYHFDKTINEALSIYQGDDVPEPDSDQDWNLIRQFVEIEIDIHVRLHSSTPSSQQLNLIRKEIAIVLQADTTLGLNFVIDMREGGSTKPVIDSGGEKPIAIQRYDWTVLYQRSRTDPSA